MGSINMLGSLSTEPEKGKDEDKKTQEDNNRNPQPKKDLDTSGADEFGRQDIGDQMPYDSSGKYADEFETREHWKERLEKRREEKGRDYDDYPIEGMPEEWAYGQDIEGYPEQIPGIDIAGEEQFPEMPFGAGEPGITFAMTDEKQLHLPVFEVLGEPNYPFLKVMVMEDYHNNRWNAPGEEPEDDFTFGVRMEREYKENSVKIKPVEPSKGYMPVLSGNFEMVYDLLVYKFKNSGTYFCEEVIGDFYEMKYDPPPKDSDLAFAKTDDDYPYTMCAGSDIQKIVDEIARNCKSDYELIIRTEEYFLRNYILDSSIINNYGDADGITEFLINKRRGNYLDFVSAYTFILRSAGIPCRLVMGYRLENDVPYQVVYADQIYVYPEVKFKDYGWVPMDVFSYSPFFTPGEGTVTDITFADATADRGGSFTVGGTVEDLAGNPLTDMSVLIYLKKHKEEPCLSYARARVEQGYYEISCALDKNDGVGKYQLVADLLENDQYRTSTSDPELKVVSTTLIEVDSPKIIWANTFTISGRILDGYSKEGIPELKMGLKFADTYFFEPMISAEEGMFIRQMGLGSLKNTDPDKNFFFVTGYQLGYNIEFEGTDLYYPTSIEGDVLVWKVHWMKILLAMVIVIISIILLILKKRKLFSKDKDKGQENKESLNPDYSTEQFGHEQKEQQQGCKIAFPQIAVSFPDLWGIKEEFLIVFYNETREQGELTTHFNKKGNFRIKVRRNGRLLGFRDLKVVDYREEIIRIGKEYLESVYGKLPDIDQVMTLREIYIKMEDVTDTRERRILEDIFYIYEKAVYSDKDIKRIDYEGFYTSVKALGY
ncbi:MAG: transglutaminase domain-containing protein [Clostridium sp.]|nr:transglutaminase domain-containing protein [Clostridium sp.]